MVVLTNQLKNQSLVFPILQLFKNPVSAINSIHGKYGDIVSINFFKQRLVFVCCPELIEETYGLEAKGLLTRDFLYEAKKPLFGNGLINSKTEIWTKQRKLIQPVFSYKSVAEWEEIILKEAKVVKNKYVNTVNTEINISVELKKLIQRIFLQVLLGKSVDTLQNRDELLDSIDIITNFLLPQMVSHLIGNRKFMGFVLKNKEKKFNEAIKLFHSVVEQEIKLNKYSQGHSLLTFLLKAKDKKTGYCMSEALLKDEMVNLLFAGQETTINALSWFFYLVSKNQGIQNKVIKEIRSFNRKPIDSSVIKNMTVTKAVLNESLRLYPPTTALALKAVDDVILGGYKIKKDTVIILSMYATHHHPGLWEKPYKFYPEHFLNKNIEEKRHKYAFFPFGGGIHHCIGRHFAELEMMLIISTLLKDLNFKSSENIKEASSVTLKPNKDVILSVKN